MEHWNVERTGTRKQEQRLVVREATESDKEVLAEFNCRLAEETEGKRLDLETVRKGVEKALKDRRLARYFVACVDERVVGQAMLTTEWSDWRCGEIWWFQSVYVAAPYRRRGVFRRLFEFVLEQARNTDGVVGVRLYVERTNESAQEVYQRLGLKHTGYLVMEHLF